MNNLYLVGSTNYLLFPIILFAMNLQKMDRCRIFLAILLLINVCLSFLFWINPVKNSVIHLCDGLFAKLSVIVFSFYVFFIKQVHIFIKIYFAMMLLFALYCFYYSNKYSSIEYCTNEHVTCHSIFHMWVGLGCIVAFV
jgi:hypothetical protein